MRNRGPYSVLAEAAHKKREDGRHDEVLAQLIVLLREARYKAAPLYRDMLAGGDPRTFQVGKVFARLVDASDLLETLWKRDGMS